jgi:hypothetical protein
MVDESKEPEIFNQSLVLPQLFLMKTYYKTLLLIWMYYGLAYTLAWRRPEHGNLFWEWSSTEQSHPGQAPDSTS